MIVDVALNPAEIALLPQHDLSTTTCVVFDVLRATSSMVTALANGASAIHPVRTIEEALALRQRFPDALLGGERHGDPIAGFELGNSPLEYAENVKGRVIVTTTTNGTFALCACSHAAQVLVGALLNIAAVVVQLRRAKPGRLLLVCAGTFDTFALEDAYAAGALIDALSSDGPALSLTDAAEATWSIAKGNGNAQVLLKRTRNGQALISKGREAEVEWCARHSQYNIVGFMDNSVIRLLPS